jgi:hypothetical protein
MFPTHQPELRAIAAQFAAALDAYEHDLETLVKLRWDPELYVKLGGQFDQMRGYAAMLPTVAVDWTELLITRLELSNGLWAARSPGRLSGRVLGLHAQHKVVIASLRRRCQALAAGDPSAPMSRRRTGSG